MRHTALLAIALLAGCGDSNKTTTLKTDDATVTIDRSTGGDGDITITSKDGANVAAMVAGAGAKWPESAPDFAAAYPGAKVTNVLSGTADGKAGGMTNFESADPPERIIAFYKARAAAAGLGKVSSMQAQGTEIFGATDAAGNRQLSVNATVSGGKTTGSVSYSVPG